MNANNDVKSEQDKYMERIVGLVETVSHHVQADGEAYSALMEIVRAARILGKTEYFPPPPYPAGSVIVAKPGSMLHRKAFTEVGRYCGYSQDDPIQLFIESVSYEKIVTKLYSNRVNVNGQLCGMSTTKFVYQLRLENQHGLPFSFKNIYPSDIVEDTPDGI